MYFSWLLLSSPYICSLLLTRTAQVTGTSYRKDKSLSKNLTESTPPCAVKDRLEERTFMAADGGLRRLFERPLPENPTLLEALSARNHRVGHVKRTAGVDPASFTEIFGELHFQEKKPPTLQLLLLPPPPPTAWLETADKSKDDSSLDALLRPPPKPSPAVKRSASFCTMKKSTSASSLLLCTEGLGSESTVDMVRDDDDDDEELSAALRRKEETCFAADAGVGTKARKDDEKKTPQSFPPLMRSIGGGGGGKRSVSFRAVRKEGRFVLTEVVIPGKELLRASREGGRLRLQFASAAAANA